MGRLADVVGRGRVLIGGYVLLLSAYCVLMAPPLGALSVLTVLVLLGAYYAATDGVIAAMGSARLAEGLRGSGLALLATVISLGRLVASVVFGVLWTLLGLQATIALFAAGLIIAMALAVRGLRIARA
jgi:predicted MFS family arabinose efflux permease